MKIKYSQVVIYISKDVACTLDTRPSCISLETDVNNIYKILPIRVVHNDVLCSGNKYQFFLLEKKNL